MSNAKGVTKEDSELFRQTVGTVDTVEHDGVNLSTPKPAPVINQTVPNQITSTQKNISKQTTYNKTTNDLTNIEDVEINDKLYFRGNGIQKKIMRKLCRGQLPIESELDLHGMTVNVAKQELNNFLSHCQLKNCRYVRIIHGKGNSSENNIPVLKNKLNNWLQHYDSILAFCSAPSFDGGTGALYAIIKKH